MTRGAENRWKASWTKLAKGFALDIPETRAVNDARGSVRGVRLLVSHHTGVAHERFPRALDRLYQRVSDDLDHLLTAVGLTISARPLSHPAQNPRSPPHTAPPPPP